jgi:hypothetical protein
VGQTQRWRSRHPTQLMHPVVAVLPTRGLNSDHLPSRSQVRTADDAHAAICYPDADPVGSSELEVRWLCKAHAAALIEAADPGARRRDCVTNALLQQYPEG